MNKTDSEEHQDGLHVVLRVRQLDELRQWVLGWGADVIVLEPESFRNRIREEAEKVLKRYSHAVVSSVFVLLESINVKEWLDGDEYKGCLAAVGKHGHFQGTLLPSEWITDGVDPTYRPISCSNPLV